MKRCKRCGRELDESEFYKHKMTKDGLQPYCKECQHELNRMRIKPKLPQQKVPQIGGGVKSTRNLRRSPQGNSWKNSKPAATPAS